MRRTAADEHHHEESTLTQRPWSIVAQAFWLPPGRPPLVSLIFSTPRFRSSMSMAPIELPQCGHVYADGSCAMKIYGGKTVTAHCQLPNCDHRRKLLEDGKTWVPFPRTTPARAKAKAAPEAAPEAAEGPDPVAVPMIDVPPPLSDFSIYSEDDGVLISTESEEDQPPPPVETSPEARRPSRKFKAGVLSAWDPASGSVLGTTSLRTYITPQRIAPYSQLAASSMHPMYVELKDWLMSPPLGATKSFSWVPMWRWLATDQILDEVMLAKDLDGRQRVTFNRNQRHGSWNMISSTHLRVECSHLGPGHRTKWCIFQSVPGTGTWIGIKDEHDLQWSIVLSELRV